MIERISGRVARVETDAVVIMVGGVGLRVRVPKSALEVAANTGAEVLLYTHLILRDDEISLYGFIAEDERAAFEVLIGVSGVGPRTALAVLSTLTVDQLRNAVRRGEPEILTRVPGIGKKTAEKMLFELKDKLGGPVDELAELSAITDVDSDVMAALTAMGFSIVEAQTAVQRIPRDGPKDVESRIMLALQNLG
jgi:Holliday junction DNA helicase RuvA